MFRKGASVHFTEKHYFDVSALFKAIKINPRQNNQRGLNFSNLKHFKLVI